MKKAEIKSKSASEKLKKIKAEIKKLKKIQNGEKREVQKATSSERLSGTPCIIQL